MSVLNADRRHRRCRRRHRRRPLLLHVFFTTILIVALMPFSLSSPLLSSADLEVSTSTSKICKDEPDVKFHIVVQKDQIKNNKQRGCDWVKKKRIQRCKNKGMLVVADDGGNTNTTTTTTTTPVIKYIWKFCKDTCGICFNTDPANTCSDNPYLFYKNKRNKNCSQWVSGQEEKRCNKKWRNQKIKNYCQSTCNINNSDGGACTSTSTSPVPSSLSSSSPSFEVPSTKPSSVVPQPSRSPTKNPTVRSQAGRQAGRQAGMDACMTCDLWLRVYPLFSNTTFFFFFSFYFMYILLYDNSLIRHHYQP
jgi:hypothetical protein